MPTLKEASDRLRVPTGIIARYLEEFREFFPRGADLLEKDMVRLELIRDGKASEVSTDRDIRSRLALVSDAPAWDEMLVVPVNAAAFAPGERPVTREDMVALVGSLAGVIMDLQDEVRSLRRMVAHRPRPAIEPPRSWFQRFMRRLVAAASWREEQQLA